MIYARPQASRQQASYPTSALREIDTAGRADWRRRLGAHTLAPKTTIAAGSASKPHAVCKKGRGNPPPSTRCRSHEVRRTLPLHRGRALLRRRRSARGRGTAWTRQQLTGSRSGRTLGCTAAQTDRLRVRPKRRPCAVSRGSQDVPFEVASEARTKQEKRGASTRTAQSWASLRQTGDTGS